MQGGGIMRSEFQPSRMRNVVARGAAKTNEAPHVVRSIQEKICEGMFWLHLACFC